MTEVPHSQSFGGGVVDDEEEVKSKSPKSKKLKFKQMGSATMGPSKAELARANFSDDELRNFEEAFSMFDIDGNGQLEVFEIERVLQELDKPMSRTQIYDLLYDANLETTVAKGGMNLEEFIQMMAGENKFKTVPLDDHHKDMVNQIFKEFDYNNDGFWDYDEFSSYFQCIEKDGLLEFSEDAFIKVNDMLGKKERQTLNGSKAAFILLHNSGPYCSNRSYERLPIYFRVISKYSHNSWII